MLFNFPIKDDTFSHYLLHEYYCITRDDPLKCLTHVQYIVIYGYAIFIYERQMIEPNLQKLFEIK